MEESRVAQIAALFEQALEVSPSLRADFVQSACGTDAELHEELRSLLAANESAAEYFEDLAAHVIAPAFPALIDASDTTRRADLRPRLEAALAATYRIERELGGGAMSRVFLAEEMKLGRMVVIKVLPPEMTASVRTDRFRREIQVAAQLQHPHIVPVLASDSADSLQYYTMPFVAGESLHARLARDGALPVADAIEIWRDVLDALAHAHAKGVIHRDIKPGNILLTGRNALVTDFGIARAIEAATEDALLAEAGLAIGTPAYMAPEQLTGSPDADHRVDLYAAGLVMYEMLEGRSPFSASSARERVVARLNSDPTPLKNADCSRELASAVMRCLATDPRDRSQSAEAILAALDTLPTKDAAHGGALLARRKRFRWINSAAVIATATVAIVVIATRARRASDDSPASTDLLQPSIAVLPLANFSTDSADAPLAGGMTEELIATLGQTSDVRVSPSTSVLALMRRQIGVRQIAESLRVRHVLEGSFQKVGNRMRMQVRLVDAHDGSTTWSETYDRDIGDILDVQDDIALAVARELDAQLAGPRSRSAARRHTPNIAAYEWYLRGMDVALMRSESGRRMGEEYFKRAIAADSNYAAAYAGLVRSYLGEGVATPRGDQREWHARAEEAALKAVALDDSLPEAHAALGWVRLASGQYAAAEAELTRAITMDRNVPRGHEGLARLYMIVGKPAAQLAVARLGMELDPFSHSAIRELALALSVNDRCDEAIERLRPTKTLTPPATVAGIIMGACYAQNRMWREAIAEFRWAKSGSAAPAFLAYALARSGQQDEARKILADLVAGRSNSNGAFGIGIVYAGFGNHDEAFAWLDKSIHEGSMRAYIMFPMFADLHRDPRFEQLKTHMGVQKR